MREIRKHFEMNDDKIYVKIYGFIYGLLGRKCAIFMYILEKSNAKNRESKHPF